MHDEDCSAHSRHDDVPLRLPSLTFLMMNDCADIAVAVAAASADDYDDAWSRSPEQKH